ASALESSLQPHYKDFISANENSPSRQMAAHASFCFLNRVRTF
ncbi:TPA: PD-(D/E)XK nuclease, partial [Klebsiella pneumoniae subsp. pneumoniae]|nr:PD-(D/E)XK nuclease [Klebsiella pneumoniae subsp. pneumoniae]